MRPADAEEQELHFLLQTSFLVREHSIPKGLVFNWDETGIEICNLGQYTMAKRGSSEVRLVGVGDKRQITVTTATAMDGVTLPLSVIWPGKFGSTRAVPKVQSVPRNWCVMQTPSHWMTQLAVEKYLRDVIITWVKKRRFELGVGHDHKALMLVDTYATHLVPLFRRLCAENNILIRYIIPGFTGDLQPQDIAINKPFKEFVQKSMQEYFEKQFLEWISSGKIAVDYEAHLQKSKIGVPFTEALIDAHKWLSSPAADRVHQQAFHQFQKCFEPEFQQKALNLQSSGLLFKKVADGRGEDSEATVLNILLEAASNAVDQMVMLTVVENEENVEAESAGEDIEALEINEEDANDEDEDEDGRGEDGDDLDDRPISDVRALVATRRQPRRQIGGASNASLFRDLQQLHTSLQDAERGKKKK
jgi:hypothetical protein